MKDQHDYWAQDEKKLRVSIYITLGFVFFIWVIKAIEWVQESSFSHFGILPRQISGLKGIFFAPLIHGDVFHLITNSVPLILLGIGLFYFYRKIAFEVLFWIWISTGTWTWTIARNSYHIGASGIIYALVSFLFFGGVFRKDARLMVVSSVVLFLYGSMLYGIMPNAVEENVSWESHLMGALSGIFLAFYFRKEKLSDPTPNAETSELEDPENDSHVHFTGNQSWTYTYKSKNETN
ncbi:MAG: rhomboid family intramembrane serine protease [Cyclobacteriaceae bacterium]|nr:rhomboid family intramembrane serine protease [Cyclobacteriaceae bacterium]